MLPGRVWSVVLYPPSGTTNTTSRTTLSASSSPNAWAWGGRVINEYFPIQAWPKSSDCPVLGVKKFQDNATEVANLGIDSLYANHRVWPCLHPCASTQPPMSARVGLCPSRPRLFRLSLQLVLPSFRRARRVCLARRACRADCPILIPCVLWCLARRGHGSVTLSRQTQQFSHMWRVYATAPSLTAGTCPGTMPAARATTSRSAPSRRPSRTKTYP